MTLEEILAVYNGSNGEATRAMYERLTAIGPRGDLAVNLFRAHKTSHRAKKYRGGNGRGSFRGQSYDTKQWSIGNICRLLVANGEAWRYTWGWGRDEKAIGFEHVLYVDIPPGQVSYHSEYRGDGPDYSGKWDGVINAGADRISRYCAMLFAADSLAGDVGPPPECPGHVASDEDPKVCARCGVHINEIV
jgi:hypothetical protein